MSYETSQHLIHQEHIKMDSMHQNMTTAGEIPAIIGGGFPNRNPLICYVCQDYFSEPALLQCYHTFCTRCIRDRDIDGKLTCPLCGQITALPRDSTLPPPDLVMAQMLELANSENPPCSNCDVRDRNNMYWCNTCGQALCNHCRENTHRAKMFSMHEVLHMSKCTKEAKKCPIHSEQYIMYSNAQKTMLCVNCFRDTAAEKRSFCVDIDTAYSQATKRLERAQGGINELQNSIRDGLIMFKNLLDELRQNMDSEKHTINTFCQGMQEAIAKTHANMIMEVQRQYETKEKGFRNQLMTLGAVLPTLQIHSLLCTNFANAANKFQFLELAYVIFERLNAVTQLSHPLRPVQSSTIRTNYRNEFAQSLEPWVGKAVIPSAIMDSAPTEVIYESAKPAPASTRTETTSTPSQPVPFTHPNKKQQSILKMKLLEEESPFSNHCRTFENQVKELCQQLTGVKERLEELHRDVTLLRRENLPPLNMRYECVSRDCNLLDETLEKNLSDLDRLKLVFDTIWEEQLCRIHVEQEIFHSQISDLVMLRNELKRLSTIAKQLEPFISTSGIQGGGIADSEIADTILSNQQQLQTLLEHIGLLQSENLQLKTECKLHPGATDAIALGDTIPVREAPKGKGRATTTDFSTSRRSIADGEQKRNVISQLIDKVNRKKSPTDEFRGTHQPTPCTNVSCVKDKERSKPTGVAVPGALTKEKSFVKTGSGKGQSATIERLESHIKEKFHDILNRRQSKLIEDGIPSLQSAVAGGKIPKSHPEEAGLAGQKYPKTIELQLDGAMQHDFASLINRKISKNDLEKLALLTQTTKALESKKIGKSCDRINDLKSLKVASNDGNMRSQKFSHGRSKTPDSSQRFCSKTLDPPSHRTKPTTDKMWEKCRAKTPTENIGHSNRGSKVVTESDYQHIANATSTMKRNYKKNRSTPSSPKGGSRKSKVYPHSDGEEEYYRRQQSGDRSTHKSKSRSGDSYPCGTIKKGDHHRTHYRQNSFESLSTLSLNSRRSSLEDKTLVLVIGSTRNKNQGSNKSLNKSQQGPSQRQSISEKGDSKPKKVDKSDFNLKQRSWETFPPKKHRANGNRSYHYCQLMDAVNNSIESQPVESQRQKHKEKEKFATINKSMSVQKRNIDPIFQTTPILKTPTKRISSQQQKLITERGYYSEYELDFDTEADEEAGDMSDNIFALNNELKLTFDHPRGRSKSSGAKGYPNKFSTFKGETDTSNLRNASAYKDDLKADSMIDKPHLSTFKGASGTHLTTFKGDKAVLSSFKSETAAASSFKAETSQSHMSTFKSGEPSTSTGSPHFRKFQGYFKGESSQSLQTYDPRQPPPPVPGDEGMKKADSFEGHEEAVRTLVAAVQETRSAAARKSK